ncbi:Pathogenesis-related protein PRMS [Apostasia shenzhenica]|uniref:Pathogenesis-related protein PRMS n=1 Tax=Apostasia shenzhenica TaxID=1088818 RepID=A0A2I0AQ20_9ASPA|nr:Pathogenesis-related protein PRMS [Apostasia shenzhenica]
MAFYSFVLLLITIFIHVAASNADSTDAAATTSEFLAPHNTARQVVGVPSLVWDKKLETFAKAYANQRRGDCLLMHSAGYAYGENIFWGEGQQWKVADIVASWVAEKQWYNYDTNSCSSSDCSHYTQIVWRNTQKHARDSNYIFSKLSIHTVLRLITVGSKGRTNKQILSVPHTDSIEDLTFLYTGIVSLILANGLTTIGPSRSLPVVFRLIFLFCSALFKEFRHFGL